MDQIGWIGGVNYEAWIWVTSHRNINDLFQDWFQFEPSGDGDCLQLWHFNLGYGWNDSGCDNQFTYFCEFS